MHIKGNDQALEMFRKVSSPICRLSMVYEKRNCTEPTHRLNGSIIPLHILLEDMHPLQASVYDNYDPTSEFEVGNVIEPMTIYGCLFEHTVEIKELEL